MTRERTLLWLSVFLLMVAIVSAAVDVPNAELVMGLALAAVGADIPRSRTW